MPPSRGIILLCYCLLVFSASLSIFTRMYLNKFCLESACVCVSVCTHVCAHGVEKALPHLPSLPSAACDFLFVSPAVCFATISTPEPHFWTEQGRTLCHLLANHGSTDSPSHMAQVRKAWWGTSVNPPVAIRPTVWINPPKAAIATPPYMLFVLSTQPPEHLQPT